MRESPLHNIRWGPTIEDSPIGTVVASGGNASDETSQPDDLGPHEGAVRRKTADLGPKVATHIRGFGDIRETIRVIRKLNHYFKPVRGIAVV